MLPVILEYLRRLMFGQLVCDVMQTIPSVAARSARCCTVYHSRYRTTSGLWRPTMQGQSATRSHYTTPDIIYNIYNLIHVLYSFIPSFIQAISIAPLQVRYSTQKRSRHSTDTVPEFHAEEPQTTAS